MNSLTTHYRRSQLIALPVCLCNVDQPVIPSEGDPYFRHGNQRTGKIIRAGC